MKGLVLLRLIGRMILREIFSKELHLLWLALVLTATSLSSIGFFQTSIQQAFSQLATEYLAADLVITDSKPVPEPWQAKAQQLGLQSAETLRFSSVLFQGERMRLATVKAISTTYPLKGTLLGERLQPMPGGSLPGPDEIWLERPLGLALEVELGGLVELGDHFYKVAAWLISEPDRNSGFFSFSPHALIRIEDVAASHVLGPGSRVSYRLLLAGSELVLKRFTQWLEPQLGANQKVLSVGNSNPRLQQIFGKASLFLGLGAMICVGLSGLVIALTAARYSAKRLDSAAVMRCFGASSRQILAIYGGILCAVAITGIISGQLLGFLLKDGLALLADEWISLQNITVSWLPWTVSFAACFLLVIGFGIVPILALPKIPPARLLHSQRLHAAFDSQAGNPYIVGILASVAMVTIAWLYVGDIQLLGFGFGAVALIATLMLVLALISVRLLRRFPVAHSPIWRLVLGHLTRYRRETAIQVTVLATVLMLMLIMVLIRSDLIDNWQAQLPMDAPNHFLINIQPQDIKPLEQGLQSLNLKSAEFHPIARGRLTHVDGIAAAQYLKKDPAQIDGLNREINLTWQQHNRADTPLSQGQWWAQAAQHNAEQIPWLSIELGFAQAAGFKLGQTLRFQIGEQSIEGRILNFRKVDWGNLHANFYVVFQPGFLAEMPMTYLANFHLPETLQPAFIQLLRRFPGVSAIDIRTITQQIRTNIDKMITIIDYIFRFVLLAALLILLTSVNSTLDGRVSESLILRTLGAPPRLLRWAFVAEFVILGMLAGFIAALVAQGAGFALMEWIFKIKFQFNLSILLLGPLAGMTLMAAAGLWSTRKLLASTPYRALSDD